jgi:serine/threonine protein kinase
MARPLRRRSTQRESRRRLQGVDAENTSQLTYNSRDPTARQMETIGKYQIVRVLGEGGMGRVYEAVDPIIGRRVAIKTISANVVADDEARARFFREAQAAGRLSHHNLITIYDIGEAGDTPYIVMEYLDGADLSRTIRGGRLSFDRKLQIMIDVCEGLAYAHGRDIVHRDIKPANIFVTSQGQVKILDFGLARGALSEVTQTGRILGTPNYMAPEQIRGEELDHRADIFSAGVVFYELLSGVKAFEGDSVATTMYKVLETHPRPVHLVDPALPAVMSLVVERALAKERTARYQTSTGLLEALLKIRSAPASGRDALSLPTAGTVSVSALGPRRRPRRSIAVGVALLALLVAGGTALVMRRARLNTISSTPIPPPPVSPPVSKPPDVSVPTVSPIPPTPASVPREASRGAPSRSQSPARTPPSPEPPAADAAPPPPSPPVERPSPPREKPAPIEPVVPPVVPPAVVPEPAARPTTSAPSPAAAAAPDAAVPDATEAVHAVLVKYQLALESRDMTALKRIWPSLSGRQEEAIRTELERARAIAVHIGDAKVKVAGTTASASCRRDYAVTTADGQTLKTATEMTMTLSRQNGVWTIDAVRHEVVR